jgi:uncharacterized protein (TIGR02145 family)
LKENLDIGTMIQSSQTQTNNGIIEKYCYGNDISSCVTSGGLYNWNEAMQYTTVSGAKGICPVGWHLPTQNDFAILALQAAYTSNPLKSVGQGSGSGAGTNTTGFSGLLVGFYYVNQFFDYGNSTSFWSSLQFSTLDAYVMTLLATNNTLSYTSYGGKDFGISVRCLKD